MFKGMNEMQIPLGRYPLEGIKYEDMGWDGWMWDHSWLEQRMKNERGSMMQGCTDVQMSKCSGWLLLDR